jgi:hypothetical protein
MCVGEWIKFITAYKGSLGYDYDDRQRSRMTADNLRQQVMSLLSCENDDWEIDCEDDDKDSANDDVDALTDDPTYT